jgi:histidyl-tRNA synthetase
MGDVTLREFLASRNLIPSYMPPTDVYLTVTSPDLALHAQVLAGELRMQGVNVAIDFGDKKLQDQIRMASKHKIPHLIVVGEDELASDTFKVRNMTSGEETVLSRTNLPQHFLK